AQSPTSFSNPRARFWAPHSTSAMAHRSIGEPDLDAAEGHEDGGGRRGDRRNDFLGSRNPKKSSPPPRLPLIDPSTHPTRGPTSTSAMAHRSIGEPDLDAAVGHEHGGGRRGDRRNDFLGFRNPKKSSPPP